MTRRWSALRPAAVVSLLLAVLAVVGAALPVAPARAEQDMRSLEEALGGSLEVGRDGASTTADRDTDAAAPTGAGAASSSDGVRGPVPPEEDPEGDDATPGREAEDVDPDGTDQEPSTPEADAPVELDDADEDVEGEGRGVGELVSGLPRGSVPIVLAVLAIVGAATAVVLTQRRRGRTGA